MKQFVLTILAGLALVPAAAQTKPDSLAAKELAEIVVSGSRFASLKKNIAQPIDIINAATIRKTNAQNMGDLLLSNGTVFVQKSQQGGSSPVIRGFEASRVLLVIDGVRMNNAIYRLGHLQNIITVDQNMLERVELIQGPGSTLFGSDALGGVIHLISMTPQLAAGASTELSGHGFLRYSSANSEKTVHEDLRLAGKKWASLTSVSYSDFGDTRIGHHDKKGFEGFGTRPQYIQPFDGVNPDTLLNNPNPRQEKFSGYQQWDLLQKILFKPGKHITHLLNLQHSNTTNVPRYDRLQDIRNGSLRFAEWYYGPQTRSLFSYQFKAEALPGFFQDYQAVLSYQAIEESRITRDYRRYDRHDSRVEKLGVAGLTLDARHVSRSDELTVGIDLQGNNLHSTATRTNLLTKQVSKLDTRYPDGLNHMQYAAVYAQHIHRFRHSGWVLNDGIRLQYVALHSTINDNSFLELPVTDIRQRNQALTGNLGFVHNSGSRSSLRLGFSSGFRAPNVDDLSKLFESSTANRQVVVPNPNIRPEYTASFDLGYLYRFQQGLEIEAGLFYTRFTNALVKAPFQLNGQDSIDYNGVRSQVLANQNVNKAYVLGANLQLRWQISEHWKAQATVNWQQGRFNTDPAVASSVYRKQSNGSYQLVSESVDSKPLDHIPPVYGRAAISYEKKNWNAEGYLLFNGWKRLGQYNADGEDNAQYATAQGTPAWQTVNLRAGYQWKPWLQLQAAVENLLDQNYRYFASGFSAPGRNFVLTVRTLF